MERTAQVISDLLRAFLEENPENRQHLTGAGIKSALIDQIIAGSIDLKNLYIIAQRLADIAKIDIRDIFFASAYEEVAGPDPRPPFLADITSFAELRVIFGNLLAPLSEKQVCAYFGIGEKVVARKWVIGWPNVQRIEQMLKFVKESREGTLFIPLGEDKPRTKKAAPKPDVAVDWRKRLRVLRKTEPKRYSVAELAKRVNLKFSTVRHWFENDRHAEPKPEQMEALRREFPEFFGDAVVNPESEATPPSAQASVSVANQQKALSSLISMMFSAINVIATVVDPRKVVEGEQARIIEVVGKLFASTGIDQRTFARLSNIQLLDPDDPAVRVLFGKHQ